MKTVDYSKSLEELENDYWGKPEFESHVVKTCHSMRKKPLKEITVEELRLVIGQGFSLQYLIPMAIELLKSNILAEGDLYEGDLLTSVISTPTFDYWKNNKHHWLTVKQLIDQNSNRITDKIILSKIPAFEKIHN
ncbi:MAG: hypothetical protein JNJ75_06480 [Cyclobacteriaceae bacterium]|nr:hypothetical protein [Cyclobacteriaceae bacterium]